MKYLALAAHCGNEWNDAAPDVAVLRISNYAAFRKWIAGLNVGIKKFKAKFPAAGKMSFDEGSVYWLRNCNLLALMEVNAEQGDELRVLVGDVEPLLEKAADVDLNKMEMWGDGDFRFVADSGDELYTSYISLKEITQALKKPIDVSELETEA